MESNRFNETSNYLTVADVRRYLNISQTAAYELSHSRDFPVCRFGGSIRIPKDAFLAWVESRTYIPTVLNSTSSMR